LPRSKSRVRIPFPAPIFIGGVPCTPPGATRSWGPGAPRRSSRDSLRRVGQDGPGTSGPGCLESSLLGAPSPSGKAELCKSSIPGSIPGGASNIDLGALPPDPRLARFVRLASSDKRLGKSHSTREARALSARSLQHASLRSLGVSSAAGRNRQLVPSAIDDQRQRVPPF
jgi:hypothetical protein